MLTPPRSQIGRLADMKTGAKILEHGGGKTLGEDVSKLGRRWYVKNPNITNGDPFTNEVEINLNMLRPLMLHRVAGEIHNTNIVTVDRVARRGGWRSSWSSWRSQVASATPLATARYSASALDRETVC